MAESGSLPTGFGELEVLAVGMVLLVEGEPGRTWGGAGTQWAPRTQVTAMELTRRGPQTLLLCASTHGASDGCTCRMQATVWETSESKAQGVRDICPEHDQEPEFRPFHVPPAGKNFNPLPRSC